MRVFGVILAGGQARRMGGADKAFVQLAGKPLISYALDRLRPQVETVILSANGDMSRFAGLHCQVVSDTVSQGPLSGILSALRLASASGATHLVSVPVDTPFLPVDLVSRLLRAAGPSAGGVALARSGDGLHPVCALWPVAVSPALAAFLAEGGAKVTRFTDSLGAASVDFPEARAFLNVNTPQDLVAAEALLKGMA